VDVSVYTELPKRVSGIIGEDSAFLKENGPFVISRTVQIPSGVNVYIEEGTEIKISTGTGFLVKGNLKLDGSAEAPIKFSGKPNAYFSVKGSNAGSEIDVNYAIFSGGKSLLPPSGDAGYASIKIRNSQITNVPQYSYIWYPGDEVIIEKNVFKNSGGFSVGFDGRAEEGSPVSVTFKNNLFIGRSNTGYWVEVWASYGSEVVVTNNSFMNGPYTAVRIKPGGYDNSFMDASGNYWGTVKENGISRMILDEEDDLDYTATIDYSDWLTSPHPQTPKGLLFK
jgi:hypothetical protein